MPYAEIPSDQIVIDALRRLGDNATALALCNALVNSKYPRRDSQLAIQRVIERGAISVGADWTLSVTNQMAAA